ncbi:MAG: FmdE family protein [Chloroflexota bacterium]
MPDIEELLALTSALHDHLCPRQVLGVRTGLLAARLFALDLPQADKRIFAFVETDGCYSDGLSVATGCWHGRRTLRLVDYGKVAATLVDTHTNDAFRITPQPAARDLACMQAHDAPDRWHAQLAAYQVMPDRDLLRAERVVLNVSMQAVISRPGLRVVCSVCGEEIMNEREVSHDGQLLCRHCAGVEPYYPPEPYYSVDATCGSLDLDRLHTAEQVGNA